MTMPSFVGHYDVDCFFAAAEVLRRPELRGLPVAVGGSGPRGVVATANYEARRFGVHSAMRMSEALSRCLGLVVVPPDFGWYRELSFEVMAAAADFAEVLEPVSLDEAYLQLPSHLDLDAVLTRGKALRAEVKKRTGLAVSFGAAPSRASAKLASEAAKPDGLFVVEPSLVREFVASRALADLPGLGPRGRELLALRGITTVSTFADLDDATAVSILGSSGPHLLAVAQGRDSATVEPRSIPSSVGSEETLTTDITSEADFARQVARIGKESLSRLGRLGMGARGVTLKVRDAGFVDHARSVSFGPPTNEPVVVLEALRSIYPEAWKNAHGQVRLVGVTLTGLSDAVQGRLDLQGPSQGWSLRRAPRTGERVSHSSFGEGVVVVGDPDASVVRFSDRVRVIDNPKDHLRVLGQSTH